MTLAIGNALQATNVIPRSSQIDLKRVVVYKPGDNSPQILHKLNALIGRKIAVYESLQRQDTETEIPQKGKFLGYTVETALKHDPKFNTNGDTYLLSFQSGVNSVHSMPLEPEKTYFIYPLIPSVSVN